MSIRRKRRKKHRRHAPGTAPGTVRADPEAPKPALRIVAYTADGIEEREISDPAEVRTWLGKKPVTWLNVDGLGDADMITRIGEIFGLHRLALEDVVNVHQRPKLEPYDDLIYLVARMVSVGEHIGSEQISIFFGRDFVLTFQERRGDCFEPVRERLRGGKGRIRTGGAAYLAYALLDAIVDGYFPILETHGERLELLEERILLNPEPDTLSQIHRIKRDLITLRRTIWPQREALSSLTREPSELVDADTRVYLRDCYDHAIQIMDILESYRELASGLVDAYMSAVSNRMNEVMKVLTIIATIFIPLTFVAGIYGMNFEYMPELGWRYAYPVFWVVIGAIATVLILFFRKKGWLGRDLLDSPPDEEEPGG